MTWSNAEILSLKLFIFLKISSTSKMATKEGPEKEPVSDCSRFSSEHSLEGIVSDESDEYHEDDLPDLVIDAHNNSRFVKEY